jgi:hypothetical protein
MISRFRFAIAIAFLLAFAVALPVLAGGWAVITLDTLPTGVVAGEPFTVGFTVLQHGITPMPDLDPAIIARSGDEKITVFVKEQGKPGHYAADMTLPSAGEWEWSIHAFTMEQKMPVLIAATPAVAEASQSAVESEPVKSASVSPLLTVRAGALGLGLIGLVFAIRRRSRLAIALTVLCLVAGVGSFMMGSAVPAVEAQSESSPKEAVDTSIPQVELGRQLFVAKGCITCHVNTKVPNSYDYWTINVEGATNLSSFSASPEILRIRLEDPTAAKSDTQMPNLGLSETEIEALIAFINSK